MSKTFYWCSTCGGHLWIEAEALPKVVDVYVGTLDGGIEPWVNQAQSTHSSSNTSLDSDSEAREGGVKNDGSARHNGLKNVVEWEYVVENRCCHLLPISGAYQVEGRGSSGSSGEAATAGEMSEGAMYLVSKLYLI